MYLKQIKAHGFKSFADKITIDLGKGITGIVGPNGSGKSNVVDAVRWVLGEQSVKSLRGEGAMTDVIFGGSKSRKPLGVASVTLVFDNTDAYLPISFNEVAIKRRVYKDGSNEYFINNEKCRLKDVITLLLDSGMAKESFNIISQGKIDEILLSKPTDRRIIFEEAAGVLKYKKRKEEALHKLDRTHDNMSRVSDIIRELEERVEPLKEQKEKALYYNKVYDELKEVDLSLLVYDIQNIHEKYEQNKKKIDSIKEDILSLNANNSKGEATISSYKNKIGNLEEKISLLQKELLKSTALVAELDGKKGMLLERKKYEVEDHKLHDVLVELKEKNLRLHNQVENVKGLIVSLETEKEAIFTKKQEAEKILSTYKESRVEEERTLSKLIRLKENTVSKKEALKESMELRSSLPYAVKAVLENVKLTGIHNVIGSLIEVKEEYATAISTSLGFAATNIVTENERAAKEAIEYLKENKLGRATFFPLSIIESRKISDTVLKTLQNLSGFVGLASDLVETEPKYKNIIENQLGSVLVMDTMENALDASKRLNHRYKMVTLDGELFHIGGSLTGGKQKTRNMIQDKYDLENYIKEEKQIISHIETVENKINEWDAKMKEASDKVYLIHREEMRLIEQIELKNHSLRILEEELGKVESESAGASHLLKNTLDEEENRIMEAYYEEVHHKDILEKDLEKRKVEKEELQDALEEYELYLRKENSVVSGKNKELSFLEVEVGKADVKLDTLLSYLTENYGMTYENASLMYHLKMDAESARNRISILKKEIKEMGPINVEAIAEYDKISARYEFLIGQREDLVGAENTLLSIIEEMDTIMIKEFKESFENIASHFETTFKELFGGGYAHLTLTDPNNLLETGIEIEASPPGKSLKSISLLSGGEKTFTAISLLFAILKSRPVPFCILDEVEAALDEANVDSFGKYLLHLKEKTQFILITHKKKTMEFADVLYGITMKESGVSKLVSVRLEEIKE